MSLHFSRCLPKTWNFRLMLLPSLRYLLYRSLYQQKKPLEIFCKKRCSKKSHQFHKKTPVLESLFKKVASVQVCNFIKKRFQHSCFLVKFPKFLKTCLYANGCFCIGAGVFFLWNLHNICEIRKKTMKSQKQPPDVFCKKSCS